MLAAVVVTSTSSQFSIPHISDSMSARDMPLSEKKSRALDRRNEVNGAGGEADGDDDDEGAQGVDG